MSEFNDSEVLARLDSVTEWDSPTIIETDTERLLSLDTIRNYLVQAFADCVAAVGLTSPTGGDFTQKLKDVAMRMHVEFTVQRDLLARSVIQTRGDGICLTFDDKGRPDEHVLLTDDSRLRGTFIGIGCIPVLTNESLSSNQTDATNLLHEPTLCLLIEDTNISEFEGITSFQGIMAVALRLDGAHIDQVIAREQR